LRAETSTAEQNGTAENYTYTSRPSNTTLAAVIFYVAIVLLLDTLAASRDMPAIFYKLRWSPGTLAGLLAETNFAPAWLLSALRAEFLQRFDLFKFTFWFVIPFVWSLRRMDWRWIGFGRWRRADYRLFGILAVGAVLIVMLVPLIPGLREYYPTYRGNAAPEERIRHFILYMPWIFSWLIGWEFMHRYFLLRPAMAAWPRYGWLLVPLSEGVYHLQKFWLEAVGMVIFSLALTWWTIRRRNAMLPFCVHLVIEIALPFFILFGSLNPLANLAAR